MGRELIFSHPDIAQLITDRFVAYAGDQWYLHRRQDDVGKFFWKVAQQGHNRKLPLDATRQGVYVATPDGGLLASDHFRPAADTFLAMLHRSLERARAEAGTTAAPAGAEAPDPRYARVPPKDGLILKSYTRIPLPAPEGGRWTPNQAVGRDHVWFTREEARSLRPPSWKPGAQWPLPPGIAVRLARFHLVDNVRGEPPMWAAGDLRELDLRLRVTDPGAGRLALEGTVRLRSRDGSRSYDARLQGVVSLDRGTDRVTRFDLLSRGEARGEGTYTRGAPPGPFPLLIAFSLAGNRAADRVPPQGSRDYGEYFGSARP